MQIRCYTCGHVFRNGLATLAELSDDQAGLVLAGTDIVREVDDVHLPLMTTHFSGLTSANFCDDCLLAIVDNPAAFAEREHPDHRIEQDLDHETWTSTVWCSCGVTYGGRVGHGKTDEKWRDVNRLRMRHLSDSIGVPAVA